MHRAAPVDMFTASLHNNAGVKVQRTEMNDTGRVQGHTKRKKERKKKKKKRGFDHFDRGLNMPRHPDPRQVHTNGYKA